MTIAIHKQKRSRLASLEGREALAAYLFILPWVIGFIAFWVIPILMSLGAAFTQWTLIKPPPRWVGIENFRYMFTEDRYFGWSLWVTVKYMLMTLIPSILLGIGLALLLNQKLRGMNLFRTIFYVPAVVSGVAVTILWLNLLDPERGAINTVLRSLGVADPPGWVNSATWAVPAVAIMSLWGVGGSAIIYLAGLQNIPAHLYEAAEIDGANGWHKFRKITLPLLSPTIFFMLITGLIGAFQVFTPAYILGGAGTWGTAKHLRFYVLHTYLKAFQESKLGYGAALAWILVILSAVVVMIIFTNSERYVYYEEGGRGDGA